MTGLRYAHSVREIQAGDAAYLGHDSVAFGTEFVPVIVVRVNQVTATVRTKNGQDRVSMAAERNNAYLIFAGADEDEDHDVIRTQLVAAP